MKYIERWITLSHLISQIALHTRFLAFCSLWVESFESCSNLENFLTLCTRFILHVLGMCKICTILYFYCIEKLCPILCNRNYTSKYLCQFLIDKPKRSKILTCVLKTLKQLWFFVGYRIHFEPWIYSLSRFLLDFLNSSICFREI